MFCIKTDKGYVKDRYLNKENWQLDGPQVDFFGSIKHAQMFFSVKDAKDFIDSKFYFRFRGEGEPKAAILGIKTIEVHSVTVEISDNGVVQEN